VTVLDQLICRQEQPGSLVASASFGDDEDAHRWSRWLEPWLLAGGPPGRTYLDCGDYAALIRWLPSGRPGSGTAWEYAHVVVGPATVMTPWMALLVPEWHFDQPWNMERLNSQLSQLTVTTLPIATTPEMLREQARKAPAVELMMPLLEQLLTGNGAAATRWTMRHLPEAVLWGLAEVLGVLGDTRPISFISHAPRPAPRLPGVFITFDPHAPVAPAHARPGQAAMTLAMTYADAGADGLHRLLAHQGVLGPGGYRDRIRLLLEHWPGPAPRDRALAAPAAAKPAGRELPGPAAAAPARAASGEHVTCPVCLAPLDWGELPLLRWDPDENDYQPLNVPDRATPQQRAREERAASVRCPDPAGAMDGYHYLPADYGRHGQPVVLAFIGTSSSGKSHLLTAMIGAIERGDLARYGINSRPIDHVLHKTFLDERVRPLLSESRVLPPTEEGVVSFVDAFLISDPAGGERTVALFDVAGGDLNSVQDAKRFLDVADGLIFVVDPARFDVAGLGDETFNTILALIEASGRLPQSVSAAIVLNKADLVRFDDPVTQWLRHDGAEIDATEILRESADVFAFLHSRGAQAWTIPYRKCAKATLHVASATGGAGPPEGQGGHYPRGVSPQRVLVPFAALLAMTGVLTGQEAQRVGI
jgi:hypothetical protein